MERSKGVSDRAAGARFSAVHPGRSKEAHRAALGLPNVFDISRDSRRHGRDQYLARWIRSDIGRFRGSSGFRVLARPDEGTNLHPRTHCETRYRSLEPARNPRAGSENRRPSRPGTFATCSLQGGRTESPYTSGVGSHPRKLLRRRVGSCRLGTAICYRQPRLQDACPHISPALPAIPVAVSCRYSGRPGTRHTRWTRRRCTKLQSPD